MKNVFWTDEIDHLLTTAPVLTSVEEYAAADGSISLITTICYAHGWAPPIGWGLFRRPEGMIAIAHPDYFAREMMTNLAEAYRPEVP